MVDARILRYSAVTVDVGGATISSFGEGRMHPCSGLASLLLCRRGVPVGSGGSYQGVTCAIG